MRGLRGMEVTFEDAFLGDHLREQRHLSVAQTGFGAQEWHWGAQFDLEFLDHEVQGQRGRVEQLTAAGGAQGAWDIKKAQEELEELEETQTAMQARAEKERQEGTVVQGSYQAMYQELYKRYIEHVREKQLGGLQIAVIKELQLSGGVLSQEELQLALSKAFPLAKGPLLCNNPHSNPDPNPNLTIFQ